MNAVLYHLDLVLHIIGFTLLAGVTLADFFVTRQVSRYLPVDKSRAAVVLESAAQFSKLNGIGGGLVILTGIGLVILLRGAVAHMLWFQIKMLLVVLIIVNREVFMRRPGVALKRLQAVEGRLVALQGVQLALIVTIFVLSVFQF